MGPTIPYSYTNARGVREYDDHKSAAASIDDEDLCGQCSSPAVVMTDDFYDTPMRGKVKVAKVIHDPGCPVARFEEMTSHNGLVKLRELGKLFASTGVDERLGHVRTSASDRG